MQARGGGLAIAAAGELAEELTETGIGKAVGWYATRRTAVAVGRLVIQSRKYSFLTEAGFSGRFKSLSSRGVAVGGDAVQEWVGRVTASEMDEILAAGGDDILGVYFRKTGTEVLDDTLLKQFLRSGKAVDLGVNFVIEAAIDLPFFYQEVMVNPYLTPEQKVWRVGIQGLEWGTGAAVGLYLGGIPGIVAGVGVVLGYKYILVPLVIRPVIIHFTGVDPYDENRNLRPLQ